MRTSIATTLILLTTGLAQEATQKPTRRPSPNAMAALLPLAPGAEWTWDFSVNDRDPVVRRSRCGREVDAGPAAGRCWELRTKQGEHRTWEYWGVRNDGIYTHENQSMGPMRGVSKRKPTQLVPGPLGITTKWKWQEIGSVQTSGGSSYPSEDELRRNYEGSIVAMAEKVTVPAGTFSTVRVKIEMTSAMFGNTEETIWFARGTGIVRRLIVNETHSSRHLYELRRYVPGVTSTETARQRIDRLLAGKPFESKSAPKVIVPLQEDLISKHLGSTFFRADLGKRAVILRDFEGKASRFHPREVAAWNRLIVEEFGECATRDIPIIASAFAVLATLHDDPNAEPTVHQLSTTQGQDGSSVRVRLTLADAAGRRVSKWAKSWFANGKMTKLEY